MSVFCNETTSLPTERLIRRVADLVRPLPDESIQLLSPVAQPDLKRLARVFLSTLQRFSTQGKPTQIQVGFHYTRLECLDAIRQEGLRTVPTPRHGQHFGAGVYIGKNPRAFCAYGDTGIVLLYIQGMTKQLSTYDSVATDESLYAADTLLGNKLMEKMSDSETVFPKSAYFDEVVLRSGSQVLPLLTYSHKLVNNAEFLFQLHVRLQQLVDEFWGQTRTPVHRILPCPEDFMLERKLRNWAFSFWLERLERNRNYRPTIVHCKGPRSQKAVYKVIKSKERVACSICGVASTHSARLRKCQHLFHEECINTWLAKSTQCPVCRAVLKKPHGKSPAGTMLVTFDATKTCHGSMGIFVITYFIAHGYQSACHKHPGEAFLGTTRYAYVPGDDGGHSVIKRLQYAFHMGLTFTIGTSATTKTENTVVWASIPHKSTLNKGPFGFPDFEFYTNCNDALDALGVPKAADIRMAKQK